MGPLGRDAGRVDARSSAAVSGSREELARALRGPLECGGKGRGPDAGEWAGTAGLDWGGLWFERGSRAEREGKEVEAGWAEES